MQASLSSRTWPWHGLKSTVWIRRGCASMASASRRNVRVVARGERGEQLTVKAASRTTSVQGFQEKQEDTHALQPPEVMQRTESSLLILRCSMSTRGSSQANA